MKFAKEDLLILPGAVGCIGAATAPRRKILAYFHDDFDGEGSYHEHECIINPSDASAITYERIASGV